MRAIFGVISLLVVMLLVLALSKKQLGSMASAPALQKNPAVLDSSSTSPRAPGGLAPHAQSQQIEQQIKQSIEAAMQQTRSVSDDAK